MIFWSTVSWNKTLNKFSDCFTMVEYHDILPEDFLLRLFPRNLSYSEESYLDNFSTCAPFVKVPRGADVDLVHLLHARITSKSECELRHRECFTESDFEFSDYHRHSKVKVMDFDGTDVDLNVIKTMSGAESVDEEGIFLNTMDDLESVDSTNARRLSDGSDPSYFSQDEVYSPEEIEQVMEPVAQRALTNAVSIELQKSELRKVSSDSQVSAQNDDRKDSDDLSNGELKKINSVDSLKPAQLKIEMKGTLIDDVRKYLVPDSPIYHEPEFNFNKSELRKTSSLKSNKTPPGTPTRKKMVRFADAMGLDLESIRHVMDAENPPRIPASAIKDLKVGVEEERRDFGKRYLDLCFTQPCADQNFMTRVMANKVALENCVITDMSITGVVRVANIGYHKCVRVRYSINGWVTFYDVMASYVQNSCDGATDRFSFTIVAPKALGPGSKISFAVSYTVGDNVYWDSNVSNNYEILCYAKTTPTDLEQSWLHFI